MPGFPTNDDFLNETTVNGKRRTIMFSKISSNGGTSAAGRYHEFFTASGLPIANALSGSAGVATQLSRTSDGALDIGADVSTDLRFLASGAIWTSSNVIAPATAILVDMLLYYPSCVVTGTPTSLNNTATLPRYTSGDGVMGIAFVQTAYGAAQPALTFTYTDNAGNTGQVSPAAISTPVNSAVKSTMHAQSAGNPWIPLLTGDSGIRKIDSYTLANGTTGTACFALCKPIVEMPIMAQSMPSERNFMHMLPPLEQIEDGACLAWLILLGGSMTTNQTISGVLKTVWG